MYGYGYGYGMRRRLLGGSGLLAGELNGFGFDATFADDSKSVAVKTAGVTTQYATDGFLANGNTSPKLLPSATGTLAWTPHNLFLNSAVPATQNVTLIVGATYTVTVTGAGGGNITGSSGASGVATTGSPATFVATGTTGTFTLTGSLSTIQINRGTVATAHLATTGAIRIGVPIEFSLTSIGTRLGMRSEPAATNPLTHSSQFNLAWSLENLTVTPDNTTAPDGTATADRINVSAGTASHGLYLIPTSTAAAHGFSVFVKAGVTARYITLTVTDGGVHARVTFDLQTATVTQVSNVTLPVPTGVIETHANGWLRLVMLSVPTANLLRLISFSGTATFTADAYGRNAGAVAAGTETFFLWMAQTELGSVATSPIPTFGTTVTRAADQVNFATSAIPFSATEGTLIVSARTPKATGATVLCQLDDGTANERFRIERDASNHIRCIVTDGGVAQATLDLGVVANDTAFKVAFAWAANDFAASLNGGAVVTDVSGTLPTVTTMRLGYSTTGEQWNSYIKTVVELPRRANDNQLMAKSA